ncbi:MAG TPA: hypothetical protein VEU08_01805, partial [Vicinamibacterales bacterium]|nr:hypothetical protein [Vicinamibacterales bacterium]
MRAVAIGTAVLCAALAAPPAATFDVDPGVRVVLLSDLHFSTSDLNDLERGKLVKRSVDTPAYGEVAVAGAERIDAQKAAFIDRVRDIERFKRGPEILQIGRFSSPPVLSDLDRLTVDEADFDVRSCRVGDCPVRLPAATIRRFQDEIDPRSPDEQLKTADLFKHVLLDNVVAYQSGSSVGRILSYDDGPQPIRPVEEFEGVLADE